ncbi:MAG: redoxin domain-containing protein [Acidobacteria bacterium]|nr:redoxin domain-containing protein [Acidobacteriota bacterium]
MRLASFALGVAGLLYGQSDQSPSDLNRIRVGEPAPDFTLPAAEGPAASLSQFRGKNVVLVFYRGYW